MIFPTAYQEYIYKSHYARWDEETERRENWFGTVARYQNFMLPRVPEHMKGEFFEACRAIARLEVMPSMRCLWTAGEALDFDNIAGYNCAYTVIDDPKSFANILYILMNGTGVGFSVERQFIAKLPTIPQLFKPSVIPIIFNDSKRGWAEGFYKVLRSLWSGIIPTYDLRKIRPAGAKLKTFGGRASGPEPLDKLLKYTINLFIDARFNPMSKLTSLECHDLVCMIANCVVVGGVRRSATISLSNLSDNAMRHAKDGEFWIDNPQRALANNSTVYDFKPDPDVFMEEMISLIRSRTGERGFINRDALIRQALSSGRKVREDFGLNPCGEIILRNNQFCNLTEAVLRSTDTIATMKRKVHYATILGVLQSTLTDFKFIGEEWKKNCEEERLIGVSLTGLNDSLLSIGATKEFLQNTFTELREVVAETAILWATELGINIPAAMTCVKPSGTVSQLVDASSGIHTRYAPYYIRRVRASVSDPLTVMMIDQGVPCNPEVGQECGDTTVVFDFPMKSPTLSACRTYSALRQLEYWKTVRMFWTDHNPSATIYVKDEEWVDVTAWIYNNWDEIAGLSFLPYDGGVYELAPYEEITETRYEELTKAFPEIYFNKLESYEKEDMTQGSHEYACLGSSCEL